MMTKIYVNYGDLHANELLRDAILSTNVSVKAKKSCDHHASGNFISKQIVSDRKGNYKTPRTYDGRKLRRTAFCLSSKLFWQA